MQKHIKRTFVIIAGVFFILLGLVGLVLPILQGVLFLAIGLLLLSLYSPTLRAWIDKHTVRFPRLHKIVQDVEEWVVRIIGRP